MTGLTVIAAGMVTPVGFNYASSCAAIRAGVSGIRQANLWDAENGEYLLAGKVDLLQWWEGLGKLADLAAPAVWECLQAAKPEPPTAIPILLGVAPPDRPHRLDRLTEDLLDEIEWRLELPRHLESRIFPSGNLSGAFALQYARSLLSNGKCGCCIIAGADSFVQQNVCEAYMEQRRILTASNPSGFIPGEAGCAVLVTLDGPLPGLQIKALAHGSGEPPRDSDQPTRHLLLTRLVRQALNQAGLSYEDTFYRMTDINGERAKFMESAFIPGRIQRRPLPFIHDLKHPVEYIGEIGAAHVPCELAVSLYLAQRGVGPGHRSIHTFGNDSGGRAALIVEYRGDSN
jgi:3-oxoacyl-[acyl-carrier-protein] synthase-1